MKKLIIVAILTALAIPANAAVSKYRELENGFSGDYWVPQTVSQPKAKSTMVIMQLYKDKAAYLAGADFIYRENLGSMLGLYKTEAEIHAYAVESRKDTKPVYDDAGRPIDGEFVEYETNPIAGGQIVDVEADEKK